MCEFVTLTDANGTSYTEKTSDCNYCACSTSQRYGDHSYYNGVCLQCGAKE